MENILREILSQDKTILSRRDDLIAILDAKVPSSLTRDYAAIKKAIKLNVGENFLVGESDKDNAKREIAEILKASGMQEARINFVIDTFTKALDWDKPQISVTEKIESTPPPPPPPPTNQPPVNSEESFNPPEEEVKPSTPPVNNPPQPEQIQQTPAQNVQGGVSKNILIGIIGILLAVVAFMAMGGKNDAPAQNNQVEQSQPEPKITFPADEPDSYTRGRTDLSLNGMDVGISTAELVRNLGQPDRIENADNGYVRYYYGDFYAAVINDIADAFVSREPKYKTLRGISVGSSYDEVVHKYGSDASKGTFEGLTLYEYPFRALDDKRGILRFAFDRNNRVDYISMRIVEENKPKFSENVQAAANAFLQYYEYMNNKNYSAAFNQFTERHKNYMGGTVSKFSRGYVDTIRCDITDLQLVSEDGNVVVFNYILDARDRAGGGGRTMYRQFSGQVIMIRYRGEWKIDEAHSSKVKESVE